MCVLPKVVGDLGGNVEVVHLRSLSRGSYNRAIATILQRVTVGGDEKAGTISTIVLSSSLRQKSLAHDISRRRTIWLRRQPLKS